jgi:hypothetical protein
MKNPKLRQMMKTKITIQMMRRMKMLRLPLQPLTSRLEPALMFKVRVVKRRFKPCTPATNKNGTPKPVRINF